jgi:hypothetical protein
MMHTIGYFALILLFSSCTALQGNPTITAINQGLNIAASVASEEVKNTSIYAAKRIEQGEIAGRKIKAVSFCGEICGVSFGKSEYERYSYEKYGVSFLGNYCAMTCGVQPLNEISKITDDRG